MGTMDRRCRALRPVVVVAGVPDRDSWTFLGASSLVHVVYVYALVRGVSARRLLARVSIGAWGRRSWSRRCSRRVVLSDDLPVGAWLAIAVVAGGLASLVSPRYGEDRNLVRAHTAAVIGTYTVIDTDGPATPTTGSCMRAA